MTAALKSKIVDRYEYSTDGGAHWLDIQFHALLDRLARRGRGGQADLDRLWDGVTLNDDTALYRCIEESPVEEGSDA